MGKHASSRRSPGRLILRHERSSARTIAGDERITNCIALRLLSVWRHPVCLPSLGQDRQRAIDQRFDLGHQLGDNAVSQTIESGFVDHHATSSPSRSGKNFFNANS